jgi:GLPGLI family protein
LGYTCKKATTVINSNQYEVWYTKEAKIKAAPTILGQDLGLVLEVIRNGNSATTAIEINKGNVSLPPSYSSSEGYRCVDV